MTKKACGGNSAATKLVFVGIGNVLKRDDGVGVYITNRIKKRPNVIPLTVEVSIENYINKINRLNSDLLILVDCMDFRENPVYWNIVPVERLAGQMTNTHNLSLGKVSELFNARAYVLGIQPKNIEFGENLSPEIKEKADQLINLINKQPIISLFPELNIPVS